METTKHEKSPNRPITAVPVGEAVQALADIDFERSDLEALWRENEELRDENSELYEQLDKAVEQNGQPHRERLPDTRKAITHHFSVCGTEGYINVGLYPDGRPGELFLTIAKEGSTLRGLADTIAVLTSLALQYGVPPEALARKFKGASFQPSGHTTNPDIKTATSISDYVFTWLGVTFSDEFRKEYEAAQAALETGPFLAASDPPCSD